MSTYDVTIGIGLANAMRKFSVIVDDSDLSESEIQEIIWDSVQEYVEYDWKVREEQ